MEESKGSMLDLVTQTVRQNEAFFKTGKTHEAWVEIVELVNDAIDEIAWLSKRNDREKMFATFAMPNFVLTVFMLLSRSC